MAGVKTLSNLLLSDEILASRIDPNTSVAAVTFDSRAVTTGSLFFALKGTTSDGHQFIDSVLAAGAAAVVVEDAAVAERFPRTILVSSGRRALALAAARWFDEPSSQFPLVGITGTNGKTTSSYLLRQIWQQVGLSTGLIGTVEQIVGDVSEASRLTTPDPLELQRLLRKMADAKLAYATMEVSSIALDQFRTAGTQFAAGLFTNLTLDHLDYHGTMESYFEAKVKFFAEYDLPFALINVDDEWGKKLVGRSRAKTTLTFGLDGKSEVSADRIDYRKDSIHARLLTPAGNFLIDSPLIGRHNLYNLLGVTAAGYALGFDLEKFTAAFSLATGAPGRLERVAVAASSPRVFVDFAHSPDALENVLKVLHNLRKGSGSRIITVFGCGGDRDRGKRPRMGEIASRLSDVTVATSDNPRTEDPDFIIDEIETGVIRSATDYHRETSRRTAIELALAMATPEDFVLVAGKGHETYQIIGTEKLPFDDREVVRRYYGEA